MLCREWQPVTCIDIDADKVKRLRDGIIPIYEPGLTELVLSNIQAERLSFTTDLAEGIAKAELIFIAVGTPQGDDGAADLSALWAVVDGIRKSAQEPKIVVVKSTVPVGTNSKLQARLNDGSKFPHEAASNPEFLKEGYAVEDFMKPDRWLSAYAASWPSNGLRRFTNRSCERIIRFW